MKHADSMKLGDIVRRLRDGKLGTIVSVTGPKIRVQSQSKPYTIWRLQNSTNYCIGTTTDCGLEEALTDMKIKPTHVTPFENSKTTTDDLTGKSNGYHFGYEGKGGAVTLPVYGNIMYESVKKGPDGKRIKPDNELYLDDNFDPTGSLKKIFRRMYPRATYRNLKKTDHRGNEIGFAAGDQERLNNLHNPVVAVVLKVRVYFNSYNSFTLDVEPDHSGIKILYDGDEFTAGEIATFEEWKKTGAAPPRFQINMAMASDLSATLEKANSDAMKARREEFYRKRGGATDQLAIQANEDADATAFFASVDAEDSQDEEQIEKKRKAEDSD